MSKRHGFYLAGDYAFRLEGQKSQAYEIAEQLGWKAPDYLVCPIGCGTNLSAIWKGFVEMQKFGLIDSLPKLIGVQPNGCNVVVKAFKSGKVNFTPIAKPDTICSAVAAGNPLDGKKVLKALKDSHGTAVEVSDIDVLETEQFIAKQEAIFVEPSGALPMAAVAKLSEEKFFKDTDVIVCVATGNGLKDPKSAVKILPDPPTIDPCISEVDSYLKHKLYHLKSEIIKNKQEILWTKIPELKGLNKIIHNSFGITLEQSVLKKVLSNIQTFETKGKQVNKQDLQNIIEESMDEYGSSDKFLDIIDFEIKTSKYKSAEASIKVKYGKKILIAQAKGVGPVDAVITALKRGIKTEDKLYVKLIDYNVEIFTGGIDASVKAIITAVDKNGNKVIAQATSPDVIAASVKAFEKCYNFLYNKNYGIGCIKK
jgi:threonine synthase